MKAKLIEKKPFTPVTIEITIESEEELIAMWHRDNLSECDVADVAKKYGYTNIPKVNNISKWSAVNALCEKFGVDPRKCV